MPQRIETWLAILYAVAAISGAAGGCMVAAHRVLRGRSVTGVFGAAYAFVGCVFALTGTIALVVFAGLTLSLERAILVGVVFGLVGAVSLASMHLSARFVFRRLGMEVDVTVRPIAKDPPP